MYQIYKITVAQGISYDSMGDCELNLKVGDKVIVKCDRYQESATVSTCKQDEPFESLEEYEARRKIQNKGRHIEGQKLPEILRIATKEDFVQIRENDVKADEIFPKTVERIQAHNLDMKLILSHYSFDRKVLLFQFSAEGRVDFRELLRDLSSLFKVRVELRQVGVRDEAAICGGVGTCGRPFCCTTFLHAINSVNVKMAKQQGLSLNPQNISGCCGRLKCCLQYETDDYVQNTGKTGEYGGKSDGARQMKSEMENKKTAGKSERNAEPMVQYQMAPSQKHDVKAGENNSGDGGHGGRHNEHRSQR